MFDEMPSRPKPGDIFVTWNLIRDGRYCAQRFEAAGLPVIVAENATWGNDFLGGHWYTLARSRHNTAGMFPVGDASRWDDLGVELAPWRTEGETVVLPQRGIGAPGSAMPHDWPEKQQGRVRRHPGQFHCTPLDVDLARAARVVTWGSGAAVKALMWGIHVESHMPNWIGEQDNTDAGRLAMFRRLAYAQWRLHEIEQGTPFARLLA
ncbi:hypothetical protein ACQQ2N_12155 [Dokdonella sp. MW10]|uniref:hypothetical protein n=1 Tax=Dokdonella sp. MW10 TaxID=2992926 RepID=UPI003F7D1DF5